MRGKVRWRDALTLTPFALISALASGWTIWEQRFHARAVGPDWAQTFPERMIIAGKAIWFYLGKLLWPYPLIFNYPLWKPDPSSALLWLQLLAVLALLWLLWLKRHSWGRAVLVAFLYFLVLLAPVLSFLNSMFFRRSFVADHYQYLACMRPLTLAAAVIVGAIGLRSRMIPHPAAAHSPVTLLIADFDNKTGDSVFDGTLEPMLGIALALL